MVKISLALLTPNREAKEYFCNLCGQMMQHDIKRSKWHDLHGFSRLAIEATLGMTDLVEAMHQNITRIPGMTGPSGQNPTTGVTGLVYRSIRTITGLVGGGIDTGLAQLTPLLGEGRPSFEREAVLAALNGVLGDYMAATRNPLAAKTAQACLPRHTAPWYPAGAWRQLGGYHFGKNTLYGTS